MYKKRPPAVTNISIDTLLEEIKYVVTEDKTLKIKTKRYEKHSFDQSNQQDSDAKKLMHILFCKLSSELKKTMLLIKTMWKETKHVVLGRCYFEKQVKSKLLEVFETADYQEFEAATNSFVPLNAALEFSLLPLRR